MKMSPPRPSPHRTHPDMPRRGATITQADVARTIRAAKQAGADSVEVLTRDGAKIIVRLAPVESSTEALEHDGEIVL